uniref:Non-compact myelin associated protein n=1 Tax=Spermophilus dauricus TaxID=99837 RepID=A0A8C9UUY6_SPEDA
MTTATTLGEATFFLNMTTRGEDFLYKSKATLCIGVLIGIFVPCHTCPCLYRKMRIRRELEPKSPKPAAPSALDPNSNSSQHPTAVTFGPADVQVETW